MFINEKEIWLVNLNPTKGIEMQKVRPCLVLKKCSRRHFIILPITGKEKNKKYSYQLVNVSFLSNKVSYINITQIRALDSSRFYRRYGELPVQRFNEIKLNKKRQKF